MAPSFLALVAAAQTPRDDSEIRLRDLRRPVDQGFVDRNSLGTSLKVLPSDLAVGRSFDRLYEVPGDPSHFQRIQGGLSVVFPRSVYSSDGESGTIATVPPGSVFRLGQPAAVPPPPPPPPERIAGVDGLRLPGSRAAEPAARPGAGFAADLRVLAKPWEPRDHMLQANSHSAARAGFGIPLEALVAAPEFGPATILVDADYRRERVETLLRAALLEP